MSAGELYDLRAKITAETHLCLEAESRTSSKERSEIVREILHAWALRKVSEATVLNKLLKSEGLRGIDGDGQG